MKIETKRLLLTSAELVASKLEKEIRWLQDAEVVKYSEQRHRPHNIGTQYAYVDSFCAPDQLFEIHLKGPPTVQHDDFIGTLSVLFDRPNRCADLGILIGEKDTWGNGYATEAWQAGIKYCFSMGADRVTCGCQELNIGMRKLAIRAGMARSHCDFRRFLCDGKRVAAFYYEVWRDT